MTTAKDHWQQTLLAPCIEARGFVADCYRTGKTFQFEDYVRDHLSKMETYQEDVDLKWLEQDIQEILSSDRRQDLRIQVNELTRRYRVVPPELFEELAKCDSRLTGSARDLRGAPGICGESLSFRLPRLKSHDGTPSDWLEDRLSATKF